MLLPEEPYTAENKTFIIASTAISVHFSCNSLSKMVWALCDVLVHRLVASRGGFVDTAPWRKSSSNPVYNNVCQCQMSIGLCCVCLMYLNSTLTVCGGTRQDTVASVSSGSSTIPSPRYRLTSVIGIDSWEKYINIRLKVMFFLRKCISWCNKKHKYKGKGGHTIKRL